MSKWRQLLDSAIAANAHLPHSRFCQLATLRLDGTPANRTLVFRGFVDGTNNVLLTTDSRTNKVAEAQRCPAAELCYYFTDSWEQFRIHGELEIILHGESSEQNMKVREEAWHGYSAKSKLQFLKPAPGESRSTEQDVPQLEELRCSDEPASTFCALILQPREVDYVNLKQEKRFVFKCVQEQWSEEEVNP